MYLENYISYFFGIIALITAMLAYQAKKRENLLRISIVTGICWVLYFFFERSYVSAVVCSISTLKLLIFLIGIRHKWADNIAWLFIFLTVTFISGFSTYRTILDIIPIIASSLVSIATYLKNEKNIRLVSFIGLSFWVANGIINDLYFALLSDTISLISVIVAFFRLDIKRVKDCN